MVSLRVLFGTHAAVLVLITVSCHAANILFISGLGGPGSHFYTGSIIAETLVNRGHHVTFLISDAFGYRANSSLSDLFTFEVFPSSISRRAMHEGLAAFGVSSLKGESLSVWAWLKLWVFTGGFLGQSSRTDEAARFSINEFFAAECESAIGDAAVIERLRGAKFDIVVGDVLFPCFVLISQTLNLPYVNVMNSLISPAAHGRLAGIPSNPALVPEIMTQYTEEMTLGQRCINVLSYGLSAYVYDNYFLGPFDRIKAKHGIKSDMSMYESLTKTEIWLMNSDFTTDYTRSLTPNVILVGGVTASPAKPLKPELKAFMDGSGDDGAILFTLSSYFNTMNTSRCNEIASAFARLPQRVLWNYNGEPPETLGSNTKLVEGLPLNDLLAHPRTRLLINHGGVNGVMEATYHGVPVLGIPLVGDQFDVMVRARSRGFAKQIDVGTLSEGSLHAAIVDILGDKRYKENAVKWSGIFRDQSTAPRERAADWIEHVLQHGGSYLRPRSLDLNFVQVHCLDIMAALVGMAILLSYVFYKGLLVTCRLIGCCRRNDKLKTE